MERLGSILMVAAQSIDEVCNPTKVIQYLFNTHRDRIDTLPAVVANHFSDVFFGPHDDDHLARLSQV